ncbi:MAG: type II toxin-antitoxin system VapC family toxin [Deltaproteobacteria bacterium]|nr:type II toxin-antitoxin system VapC family toxin [Deltaproteobacteria bacterium]
MRTVVDASVALKWYLPERGAREATSILADSLRGARELIAPDLILLEIANVLWKKARRDECDPAHAQAILDAFEIDAPRLVRSAPLAQRALDLALRLDAVVYDCIYLAAAIENEAALVTADVRLASCARGLIADVELIA